MLMMRRREDHDRLWRFLPPPRSGAGPVKLPLLPPSPSTTLTLLLLLLLLLLSSPLSLSLSPVATVSLSRSLSSSSCYTRTAQWRLPFSRRCDESLPFLWLVRKKEKKRVCVRSGVRGLSSRSQRSRAERGDNHGAALNERHRSACEHGDRFWVEWSGFRWGFDSSHDTRSDHFVLKYCRRLWFPKYKISAPSVTQRCFAKLSRTSTNTRTEPKPLPFF
jgi:hypothetical protein